MGGALARFMQRQLSMAWEQWQFWYEEVKNQQFRMAGALNRMKNMKLSQAWEQWQYWYEMQGDMKFRMLGALNRMKNLKHLVILVNKKEKLSKQLIKMTPKKQIQ